MSLSRTNTNAVPSTFWCTLECFSDPTLLARVRHEVKKSMYQIGSDKHRFDVEQLGKSPLLQSIYAEVLRLRIAAFIMRSPERDNIEINDWILPKGQVVLVATTPAHMDEDVWNTGQANEHPRKLLLGRSIFRPSGGPWKRSQEEKGPSGSSPDPRER